VLALPLLMAQVVLDQLRLGGRERGRNSPEHVHEVVDFFRLHGMADVGDLGFAGNGPIGIGNQFAVFIEKGEEGQACALARSSTCCAVGGPAAGIPRVVASKTSAVARKIVFMAGILGPGCAICQSSL